MKICIGIISYIPDRFTQSQSRKNAIQNLVNKINEIFKGIPIMIVTQNWIKFDVISNNKVIRYDYDEPLGITPARKILREKFLESEYDYMIMLDDDSVIVGTDGSNYLKEIKLHPDGFGWFSNHLLKLFAISKYVYSRVDMPDISAESLEGFEDKIFISMCRIKFPDREFEFDRSKLDEVSFGYAGGPPSTWWTREVALHRSELRKKTNDFIAEYAKKNNSNFIVPVGGIEDDNDQRKKVHPIDIVVTYVDNQESGWQSEYLKYKRTERMVTESDQTTSEVRFRDPGTFKFWFRGVDKNCSWVNKVFLIVQDENQIPKWLDRSNKKLRIVYHDEYIPHDLLPTFNSNVIEMYIPYINDLSDNYILCNDDTFFINEISRDKLFDGNIPKHACSSLGGLVKPSDDFMTTIANNTTFLNEVVGMGIKSNYKHPHLQTPHKKYIERYLLDKYAEEIKKCFETSHFRSIDNITTWMYDEYLKQNDLCVRCNTLYLNSKSVTLKPSLNYIDLGKKEMVCINDTARTERFEDSCKYLLGFLSNLFPDKCSFEVEESRSGREGLRNYKLRLQDVDLKRVNSLF